MFPGLDSVIPNVGDDILLSLNPYPTFLLTIVNTLDASSINETFSLPIVDSNLALQSYIETTNASLVHCFKEYCFKGEYGFFLIFTKLVMLYCGVFRDKTIENVFICMACHTCTYKWDVCQCFSNSHWLVDLVLKAKNHFLLFNKNNCALKHLNNKYAGNVRDTFMYFIEDNSKYH